MILEERALAPFRETATVDAGDPWPGLAPFQEADHAFFFGREAATNELLNMVHRGRLTVLFSLSGLGKSSLLCAGLFPRLRGEGFLPVYLRPGFAAGSPEITAQVRQSIAGQAAAAGVEAPEPREGETLWELFHRQGGEFWGPRNRRVIPVLAFDQFEEIFKVGRGHPGLQAFLTELADLIEGRVPAAVKARLDASPEEARRFTFRRHEYKVLLALREDSLPDLEELRPAIPSLAHNRMRLTRMTGDEALEVVNRGGGELVEPGTAEQIVRFVADEGERTGETALARLRVQPPFLSLVCRELNGWRRERGLPRITGDLLSGQQKQILEDFYERNVADLDPRVHTFIEERLLTASGFRDTVAWENALREGVTEEDLNRLIERRLVCKEVVGERPRIELAHDRLIDVIRASRDARRQREGMAAAEAARRLAEERERQARRRLRQARWTAAAFAFLCICALLFAGLWFSQRNWSREMSATADLRWAVSLLAQGKESEALPFLAAAVRHDPRGAARGALLGLLLGRRWAMPVAVLQHGDVVDEGHLGPDGRFAVTVSRDRKARIWEIATGDVVPLAAEVATARFSPNGMRIATGGPDGVARIWNVQGGTPAGAPLVHGSPVTVVEWSPDGRGLITASNDGSARIWDVATGRTVGPPLRHEKEVTGAAWSPNGLQVATASRDGTARIWNAATGLSIGPELVHEDQEHERKPVFSVRFSPDGRRLVTASLGVARLWEVDTGEPSALLQHGSMYLLWAEFSPDREGRFVVTASADRTARLWDAATGSPLGEPMRHGARVRLARFGPGGRSVLTASDDGTARLWQVPSGLPLCEPLRHGGWVYDAEPGRDGRHVLTTSEDKTARVWDVAPQPAAPLVLRHDRVLYAELDPAGTRAVTASRDGTVLLWNARTGEPVGQPMRHVPGKAVRGAHFSPDGRRVVTASDDGTARLWNAATGEQIGPALPHPVRVTWADFSPDGSIVVTTSQDHTHSGRLWDAATGRLLAELRGHGDRVGNAAFSPDGRFVATTCLDKKARIWQVPSGRAVSTLPHDDAVITLAWVPGKERSTLITASVDQEVRIWSLREGRAVQDPIRLRHERVPHGLEVDPFSRWVMTWSGWEAWLWDLATGRQLGGPLVHGSEVAYASLSPDGERAVTAGDHKSTPGDHLVRVWDLRSRLPLGVPLPHESALLEARFSHDGQRLITVSYEGIARIWDVPTGRARGAGRLADLAEALAGAEIPHDLPEPVFDAPKRIARLWLRLQNDGTQRDLASNESLLRWLLTPPEQRSATPLAGSPRLRLPRPS